MSSKASVMARNWAVVRLTAARAAISGSRIFLHLLDGGEEFPGVHGGNVPAQDIAVEDVPVLAGLNARANLCAGFKQPLGVECFYGFPHRCSACAIDPAPVGFIGQNGARRINACKYLISDALRQLAMQIAVVRLGQYVFFG